MVDAAGLGDLGAVFGTSDPRWAGAAGTAGVRTVVPVGEERSRQFELRLTLANNALSVGTAIEVGLPEREATESLVVPRDAIAVRQDGNYVMRVRSDNTAEKVAVTSVATDGDLVTIRGPVSAGDLVVVAAGAPAGRAGTTNMVQVHRVYGAEGEREALRPYEENEVKR